MRTYQYIIYNLKVSAGFEIPMGKVTQFACKPEVIIRMGVVPEWIHTDIRAGNEDCLTENSMWFYIPGMAIYMIEGGNQITVQILSEEFTPLDVCSYLTGSAFTLLLIQRGYIPVHGGMVVKDGCVAIISGRSGAGKSTTVMELLNRGFRFMSDDVSAILVNNESITAIPAFPQQKLCRDIIIKYQIDESNLIYIDEDRDKYARPIPEQNYEQSQKKLNYMIEIVPYQGDNVQVQEVQGVEKLKMLTSNLYRGLVYEKMGISMERMDKFLRIASGVKMYQILRPQNMDSLDGIVNSIQNKILQVC